MKNKILIFVFTILTFGLFLVPLSFAKTYNIMDLNKVNRVENVQSYYGSSYCSLLVDMNISDIQNTGIKYASLIAFDENYNLTNMSDVSTWVTWRSASNYSFPTYDSANKFAYSNFDAYNGYFSLCRFELRFGSSTALDNFKSRVKYFNALCYSSTSTSAEYPYLNYFVGNSYYDSFKDLGVFNNAYVYLRRVSYSDEQDITNDVLYYNTFSFSSSLVNTITSINNTTSANNYYIRFYFNDYVKNMSNFNLSYLELIGMSNGNTYYGTYSSSRNALPILSSSINLYNDNTTLFTTNDLVNSGYGDYYIEYIDFRIADYSFKSSTYYNSNIGINGYLTATRISALDFNNIDVYNTGYSTGYQVGYESGKTNGYNEGVASNKTSFDGLMLSVANVPMTIISGMLNFEILGVNLLSFFMGIITLVLFVHLMRKFKE